jgi:acetolactate synthase I/II/III large subunit
VFAQNYFEVSHANHYFPNSGISSLGHAIPAAIGARCFAQPASPTFAILGDGGFQMCCMELMTAVNYGIPLNVVVINNGTMGLIRKNQFQLYQRALHRLRLRQSGFRAARAILRHPSPSLDSEAELDALFAEPT